MSQRIALVRVVVPLATTVLLAGGLAAPSIATADDDALAAKKKKSKKKRYASITGTLSKRGYTVIALAKSSAATTRRIKGRKFRLRPPASRVTLHLRAPNGVYAGPIVLRGRSSKAKKSAKGGKKAIVGVNAGARLGKVRIKRRAGYALAKTAGRWLDRRSVATARKGVPIGARNFGRVRVRKLKGGNSDRDRDGIPTSLDIDDDGDLVLDNLDATTGAKKSTATASAVFSGEGHFETITILDVGPNRVQGGLGLPPPPGFSKWTVRMTSPPWRSTADRWSTARGVEPGSAKVPAMSPRPSNWTRTPYRSPSAAIRTGTGLARSNAEPTPQTPMISTKGCRPMPVPTRSAAATC